MSRLPINLLATEILGVELGEEFYILNLAHNVRLSDDEGNLAIYKFDDGRLWRYEVTWGKWLDVDCELMLLLYGDYTIVKKPKYKKKHFIRYERYFVATMDGEDDLDKAGEAIYEIAANSTPDPDSAPVVRRTPKGTITIQEVGDEWYEYQPPEDVEQ